MLGWLAPWAAAGARRRSLSAAGRAPAHGTQQLPGAAASAGTAGASSSSSPKAAPPGWGVPGACLQGSPPLAAAQVCQPRRLPLCRAAAGPGPGPDGRGGGRVRRRPAPQRLDAARPAGLRQQRTVCAAGGCVAACGGLCVFLCGMRDASRVCVGGGGWKGRGEELGPPSATLPPAAPAAAGLRSMDSNARQHLLPAAACARPLVPPGAPPRPHAASPSPAQRAHPTRPPTAPQAWATASRRP
jgi:hypothetical protein